MALKSKTDFYDGLTAIPIKGTLIVTHKRLVFQPDNVSNQPLEKSWLTSYQQIREINEVGGKLRVEVESEINPGIIHLFVIEDISLKEKIEEYWSYNKGSFLFSFLLKLNNLSLAKKIGIALIFVPIFVFIFLGFIFNTYQLVPVSLEIKLGEAIYREMIKNLAVCKNTDLENSLTSMINRLKYKESPYSYQITIVKNSIVNAFALPGEHIIVFSGLIEQSKNPEEVAGVLAHEMSHIDKRHGLQNLIRTLGISFLTDILTGGELPDALTQIANNAALLKYSRDFEREADALAVEKLHHAKISVRDFIHFFDHLSEQENIKTPQWMSTHPVDTERIDYLTEKQKLESFSTKKILKGSENWDARKKGCSSDKKINL